MRRRWPAAAAALCGLVLLAWRLVQQADTPREPVYGTAEVRAVLRGDPDAWMNRTLLVRGVAEAVPCTPAPAGPPTCPSQPLWLAAAGGASTGGAVPLRLEAGSRLLTTLRRIPLVGALTPAPQVLRWGAATTYRVQLRAGAFPSCGIGTCYEALLLDAVP